VFWKNEEGKRAAIVQSVNASDRTAVILLTDTRALETVSVLELDPYATFENNTMGQPVTDGFGVRRSDFVFIHPEGTTNGFEAPHVPNIGELEAWIHDEMPSFDLSLTGWRKEMDNLGKRTAAQRSRRARGCETMTLPNPGDGSLHWFGEVTGVGNFLSTVTLSDIFFKLNLDGTVEVMHPDSTVKTYPLERLTRLYDGIEQLENEGWAEDAIDGSCSETEEVWAMNEDGTWRPDDSNDPDWEDEDEEFNDAHSTMDWTYDDDKNASAKQDAIDTTPPKPSPVLSPVNLGSDSMDVTAGEKDLDSAHAGANAGDDGENWKRFDILPSAPVDHAFYSSTPATPSRTFLSRINREYRALANSLPGMLQALNPFHQF